MGNRIGFIPGVAIAEIDIAGEVEYFRIRHKLGQFDAVPKLTSGGQSSGIYKRSISHQDSHGIKYEVGDR
jgi:hypothetical protein